MRFERRLKPQNQVNLTPLIDVILMIIIFFMVTSVFKITPGIELNLPDSGSAEAVALTDIHITAVSDQELYVNKTRTELAGLRNVLKKEMEGKDLKKLNVVVEGEKSASYQLMIAVLDELRIQGVNGVNLMTSKTSVMHPKEGSPASP